MGFIEDKTSLQIEQDTHKAREKIADSMGYRFLGWIPYDSKWAAAGLALALLSIEQLIVSSGSTN